ncbi:gas vesicle protein GvpG [Streptacidiphilus neutrinimicus]|uniref:gas vesicle protein GvpG n=1 Tax=Streptacidiphilus neutrinimicus TaxID=105420 RepID=UPI0005A717CF|nr:gas vesicle protein GvpG [Streptacidiphilus neutrinimicus]
MGLVSGLLTLPLAPVRGVVWVAERLYDQALRELTDPERVRAELDEVDRARAEGEISQEEADQREQELLQLLWQGRETGGGLEV